jgi:hypothetical protein
MGTNTINKERCKMKRSAYLMQILLLLIVKVFISSCETNLSTEPDIKGPGNIDVGPNPIDLNNDYSAEQTFEFEYGANQKSTFTLEGVNGNVHVEQAYGQSTFKVFGKKRVFSSSQDDAENGLDYLDVSVENYHEGLKVKTVHPHENGGRNYSVDYWIYLPKNVDLKINSANSNVKLQDVEGNAWIEITNGEIDAQVRIPVNGELKMNNVNGDMKLRLPRSTSAVFNAESSLGTINMTSLSLTDKHETKNSVNGILGEGEGVVHLKSTNGNLSIEGF